MFAAYAQARKLQACWSMIVARERASGLPFDYVVRVRPDVIFDRPFDLGRCVHAEPASSISTIAHA